MIGGVYISEWCALLIRECDSAFINGANLATVFLAISGAEAYLKTEYSSSSQSTIYMLLEECNMDICLKENLQILRKFRNKWTHIDNRIDDQHLLSHIEDYEKEIKDMAFLSVKTLRKLIYSNQSV